MKFRFVRDILIYIILPILIFNNSGINNLETILKITSLVVILYSIFTKVTERRINFTGLIIFFIISIYFLFNSNPDLDYIYFYNTCIFLFIALLIPFVRMFNRNISIIIIKDILKSLNKNTLPVVKILKKKSMMSEINQVTAIIESNFIIISIMRIINILAYNGDPNSKLNTVSNCIFVAFSVMTIYKVIKTIFLFRKLNVNKTNKNSRNDSKGKGKVINFNSFR